MTASSSSWSEPLVVALRIFTVFAIVFSGTFTAGFSSGGMPGGCGKFQLEAEGGSWGRRGLLVLIGHVVSP